MITRERHTKHITFHCDGCSEVFVSDTDNFTDAYSDAKKDGFTSRKEDNEWVHYCAICAGK